MSYYGRRFIFCDNVEYRRGIIEVTPNIHEGCINLETWRVSVEWPGTSAAEWMEDEKEALTSHSTEIELSIEQAKELIAELQEAIEKSKS